MIQRLLRLCPLRLRVLLMMSSMAVLSGCFGAANDLNAADAKVALNATNGALNSPQFDGVFTTIGEAATVECSGGGTVELQVTRIVTNLNNPSEVTFEYSANFDSCIHDGVNIHGRIKYVGGVSVSASGSTIRTALDGDLYYSGTVYGSCSMEVQTLVTTDAATATVVVEASGTFCGHDSSTL